MVREREGSSPAGEPPVVAVSNTKYVSGNPLARRLLRGFASQVGNLLEALCVRDVLEVGCGEGILLRRLSSPLAGCRLTAVDVAAGELVAARRNVPSAALSVASVYSLPFRATTFDLVLCSEVLEHLTEPERALEEIGRVGRRHFLFSVPNEPLWRVLNLCRGAYPRTLGNPPGHVRHWGRKGFLRLLAGRFEVEAVRCPLPWIVALCRRKDSAFATPGER